MLLSRVSRLMACLGALAMIHAPAARAQGEAPEEVLKRHNLKRSGSTYVSTSEAEVLNKSREAGLISHQLNVATMQQEAFEAGAQGQKELVQQLVEQRMWLNQQLAALDQQLAAMTMGTTANFYMAQRNQLVAQRNQLAFALNTLSDRINLLGNQEADPALKEKISAEVSQKRGAYMEAVMGLRQVVDRTNSEYAKLAKDASVTKALTDLSQKLNAKPALKLGPSSAFLSTVKTLERVERSVLSDKVDLTQEGGVYHLDVTLNGKVTIPFVFDTGASLTTISSEVAARIGLEPGPNDPPLRLHVADGTVIEARQKTIPTVRVGRFSVNNVVCAVMPPGKTKAPLLLGQSFFRHFTYKFTPESRQLVLTQIGSMDGQQKTARTTKNATKGTAKKKTGRRPYRSTAPVEANAGSDPF
jgi:clan AA aspartic protease (TIGR02281 family)